MRVLYLDCFSGVSGDMMLGALLDLGINISKFKQELSKLNLEGYELKIEKKISKGISVMDVQVILDKNLTEYYKHHHDHAHDHNHDHHHLNRNLITIEGIIDSSKLSDRVKDISKKVFREIARAEAKVHNKDIYEIHFHEVGAIDSIVDIVGVAICIDMLKVQRILCSPLHEGSGFIECEHGVLPVPVPAVMEMLSGSNIPVIVENINTELVTPTGIGLVKTLSSHFGPMPPMNVEEVGYGLGKRETGRLNALRAVIGTLFEEDAIVEDISILETNIDDMTSEFLGYIMEKLFDNGALDVYFTSIYMKKNRPAVKLTVMSEKHKENEMLQIILKETSTFGVRRNISQRYVMRKEFEKFNTPYGDVKVNVGELGEFKKYAPEYEDCKQIAAETGEPLYKIYNSAYESARRSFES